MISFKALIKLKKLDERLKYLIHLLRSKLNNTKVNILRIYLVFHKESYSKWI